MQLQIPMEQRDSTPPKHHSETAIPDMTTTQTCHFHETLRLCSEMHHLSCVTYHFLANHNRIAAQTDTWHIHEKSLFRALPNGRAIGAGFEQLRTAADGCERLRTVADGCGHENNVRRRTQLYPQTPKLNENPSLRIREKRRETLHMFDFCSGNDKCVSTTVMGLSTIHWVKGKHHPSKKESGRAVENKKLEMKKGNCQGSIRFGFTLSMGSWNYFCDLLSLFCQATSL